MWGKIYYWAQTIGRENNNSWKNFYKTFYRKIQPQIVLQMCLLLWYTACGSTMSLIFAFLNFVWLNKHTKSLPHLLTLSVLQKSVWLEILICLHHGWCSHTMQEWERLRMCNIRAKWGNKNRASSLSALAIKTQTQVTVRFSHHTTSQGDKWTTSAFQIFLAVGGGL